MIPNRLRLLLYFSVAVFGGRGKTAGKRKKEVVKILALLPEDDNYLFREDGFL